MKAIKYITWINIWRFIIIIPEFFFDAIIQTFDAMITETCRILILCHPRRVSVWKKNLFNLIKNIKNQFLEVLNIVVWRRGCRGRDVMNDDGQTLSLSFWHTALNFKLSFFCVHIFLNKVYSQVIFSEIF